MQMYLRYSALILKQVSENILFFAVGITFSVLVFQIFTRILLLKIKTVALFALHSQENIHSII
jgi:hypothetical protein